ncbi:MAG: hypothetical protein H7Z76_08445 [Methylotenera sp.]|nr:hypothetical protein [Flavobacterium sp.]
MKKLYELGFKKNTFNICGFRPHYRKGNDLLFLIGADFWISKIVDIKWAYEEYPYKVYGVVTDKAPYNADKDWVTTKKLLLLKLEPLSIAQWSLQNNGLEYMPTTL